MKGYIYIITNLITNKQYVGQTINTIQKRFRAHISDAKNKTDNMYIHKSMNKYGIENFKVEEITCVDLDNEFDLIDKLNYLEKFYISFYNTLSPNGYNLTKGGTDGCESDKIKVDEYDLDLNFIKTHDSMIDAARSRGASTSTAIGKCCIGKSKFAFQRIWRYHNDSLYKYELPNKRVASREYKLTPVDKYSKSGKFIESFVSIVDANKSMGLKNNSSHISECCMGNLISAYGYVWRFSGDPFDIYNKKDKRYVICEKYDLDNNFIERFNSIKEAALSIGDNISTISSNIRRCCNGGTKTAYGYKWKFIQ